MQITYETKASIIFLIDSTYQVTKDNLIVIPKSKDNRFQLTIVNKELKTVYGAKDELV